MGNQWSNPEAVNALDKVKAVLGEPDVYSRYKNGAAVWTEAQLYKSNYKGHPICLAKVMVIDELVPHGYPTSHADTVYTAIRVELLMNDLKNILPLTGALSFNPLKKLLIAHCESFEANIAILKLATDILIEKDNMVHIKTNDTLKKLINQAKNGGAEPLYLELCANMQILNARPSKYTTCWPSAAGNRCEGYMTRPIGSPCNHCGESVCRCPANCACHDSHKRGVCGMCGLRNCQCSAHVKPGTAIVHGLPHTGPGVGGCCMQCGYDSCKCAHSHPHWYQKRSTAACQMRMPPRPDQVFVIPASVLREQAPIGSAAAPAVVSTEPPKIPLGKPFPKGPSTVAPVVKAASASGVKATSAGKDSVEQSSDNGNSTRIANMNNNNGKKNLNMADERDKELIAESYIVDA